MLALKDQHNFSSLKVNTFEVIKKTGWKPVWLFLLLSFFPHFLGGMRKGERITSLHVHLYKQNYSSKQCVKFSHSYFKRYSKIDQHLARQYNVGCLSSPPPFSCSKIITPFSNLMILHQSVNRVVILANCGIRMPLF